MECKVLNHKGGRGGGIQPFSTRAPGPAEDADAHLGRGRMPQDNIIVMANGLTGTTVVG